MIKPSKKCPTYYPGDIRILTQRNIPELSHLVDVVVFPTDPKMKRPHPHEIHESDLDGDEYFVCWDENLVPEREQPPMKTVVKDKVRLFARNFSYFFMFFLKKFDSP